MVEEKPQSYLVNLPLPLVVIDFEASSLEDGSYPIEVGIAVLRAPENTLSAWSALIRPTGRWSRNGHWSRRSAAIHGISREELSAAGRSPAEVAAALNGFLGQGIVFCDGGAYDAYWLRRLFIAASMEPLFSLGDWGRLLFDLGPEIRRRVLDHLEQKTTRHRAREDACQLVTALAQALGIETGAVRDLSAAPDQTSE